MKRLLKLVLIILLIIPTFVTAQNAEKDAKSRLESLNYYLGLEKKIQKKELNDLAKSLVIAEDPTKSRNERREHWTKIHTAIFKAIEDPDSTFYNNFLKTGRYPFFATVFNHKIPDYGTNPSSTTSPDSPGKVEHHGDGDETIIIIPPAGFDASIYSEFIEMNKHNYSIYTITLPGYGGVPPYAREERRQLAKMTWLNNIESGLTNLMARENIESTFLLGNGLGARILTHFAINNPNKVKGIIAINGTFNTNMPSTKNPGQSATASERKERMQTLFPLAELIAFPVFQPHIMFQSPFSKDSEGIRNILIDNLEKLDRQAHAIYFEQLKAIDVSEEITKLKVPLLSIVPLHDELSPLIVNSRRGVIAWQKLKHKNPESPIHLHLMPKTRNLVLMDKAREASDMIAKFILDPMNFQLGEEAPASHAVNRSPRSTISQTFSNTDVTVNYSRPAVNGREVFGKLVPYNKIWRAGSNEATEITFSRDTWLEGNLVKRGTYSLFIEPKERSWTIVLNRILGQWGAFNYDSTYDVLRFDVPVQETIHHEHLKYDFEELTNTSMNLTIAWSDKKVSVGLKEAYSIPMVPDKVKSFAWNLLLEDVEGDGRSPSSSDGKAFSYFHDRQTDSIWFQLKTHNKISFLDPAISVSIDTDNNQTNGAPWYGTNRKFKVDIMLSAGPVRQGDGYVGWNGITDAQGIRTATWMNVTKDNLTFYFDTKDNAYYLGMKRSDLGKNVSTFNLIGSVGANSMWNDDIGKDGTWSTITLSK